MTITSKSNVVTGGTIVHEYGLNYLVVVDAPHEPNPTILIPISREITTIGSVVVHEVLWPTHLAY